MAEIDTSSAGTRSTANKVDTLFLLDRQQTSFLNLFKAAKEFVSSKDPESKWKDFWAGSVGTTLSQLMAGHSEYNAYYAIMARREAYLYEAQQRSSAVAIASTLGYSVFRGQNLHLLITFIPSSTTKINQFDIVGGFGSYDLVALEDKVFTYGQKAQLLVAVGKLMEESIRISAAKTYWFRFYSEKVSEDIALYLNGDRVPHTRKMLEALQDKFVVLSNSVGGIDALYINRYPPANWSPMTKYTLYDYVNPNYSWRGTREYKVGDVVKAIADTSMTPVFFKCIVAGSSGANEPLWPSEQGQEILDNGIRWKHIGSLDKPRFFKSLTPGIAVSSSSEPNWPTVIGTTVREGDVLWGCVDTYTDSQWNYDTGDVLKLLYVESEEIVFDSSKLGFNLGTPTVLTIENKYQEPENIPRIRELAPLYHETQHVIRGREDYRKLLKEVLLGIADTNSYDLSPAVVAVTYVKDHTQKTWRAGMLVKEGDEILPTYQNGFIYRAKSGGYVADDVQGKTLDLEPTWSMTINTLTDDGQVVWRTLALNPVVNASSWMPKRVYKVGDYCIPRNTSAYPGIMLQVDRVITEPAWPSVLGATIVDNEVTWECADTIYLEGYDAPFYELEKNYKAGDYVQPVLSTGYFYVAKTDGKSGTTEPDWPVTICDTVIDNGILWECYDLLDSKVYQKNTAQRLLETYRPFGVQPPRIVDPVIVHVGLGIYIDLQEKVDESKVKDDVLKILSQYQKVLGLELKIVDFENLIEQNLSYVRIARIYCLENTKTRSWRAGMLVKDGDVVVPSDRPPAPGFSSLPSANASDYTKTWVGLQEAGYTDLLYRAKLVSTSLQGKTSGYTAFPDRGISGTSEPDWPYVEGATVKDGPITWTMVSRSSVVQTPPAWLPSSVYFKDALITPTNVVFSTVVAKVTGIEYKEPAWPTTANKAVRDNEVYWISFDPQERILPLAWNEYYIFRSEFKITMKGQDWV